MGLRGPKPRKDLLKLKEIKAGTFKIFADMREANVYRTNLYNAGRKAKRIVFPDGKIRVYVLDRTTETPVKTNG